MGSPVESTTSHQDTIMVNLQIENVTSLKGNFFYWDKKRGFPGEKEDWFLPLAVVQFHCLPWNINYSIQWRNRIIAGQKCNIITSRFLHWHRTQQEVLGTFQYNWLPRENYIRRPCRAFQPMFLHRLRLLSSLFCKFAVGSWKSQTIILYLQLFGIVPYLDPPIWTIHVGVIIARAISSIWINWPASTNYHCSVNHANRFVISLEGELHNHSFSTENRP